jgi:hypothetical protein
MLWSRPRSLLRGRDGGWPIMRSVACFANVAFALALSLQSCRRAEPPPAPESLRGSAAPETAGEDLDGVVFRLSDYRGQVVLLDFWGNW